MNKKQLFYGFTLALFSFSLFLNNEVHSTIQENSEVQIDVSDTKNIIKEIFPETELPFEN